LSYARISDCYTRLCTTIRPLHSLHFEKPLCTTFLVRIAQLASLTSPF